MKQAQDKLPSMTVRASTRTGSAFHYSHEVTWGLALPDEEKRPGFW